MISRASGMNTGDVLVVSLTDLVPQRDHSNSMGFPEFKELWQVLSGWKTTFMSYDGDRSGTVEGHELQHAFNAMGTGAL